MAITSVALSTPMSPEPWQAETETTYGEEISRDMIFLRYRTTALITSQPMSLVDLYRLLPETRKPLPLSLVSRCAHECIHSSTTSFWWMNYVDFSVLQTILPNLQKPRFPLSNLLLYFRLILVYLAILGVRRLHQRTLVARLSWLYKGYVGTMVIAPLVFLLIGSQTYQGVFQPQKPLLVLKLRSVFLLSVFCQLQSLCGILDHHYHGREDPPVLSWLPTYPLHLFLASSVNVSKPNTLQPSSCPKLRSMYYSSVSHLLLTLCGILDHHFHGREGPPGMVWLCTYSCRILMLAAVQTTISLSTITRLAKRNSYVEGQKEF
ncbi:PREDICTED: uncharacterized protein LOC104714895 [Camelina sativa]|uniref:Uncharacterized protein LOC104714895 n=1 Tax=Camelina sativa TaxID=90675 RepID=A0ABM1QF41_CAMSA|nr:PREDICTED: uncharacterized protein LOC104714895 [Camelina sativa]